MRRNWKRLLSLLLTVAMVFTMNTAVFADITDGADPAESTVAQWTADPTANATATADNKVKVTDSVTLTAEAGASAIEIDATELAAGKTLTLAAVENESVPNGIKVKVADDGRAIKIDSPSTVNIVYEDEDSNEHEADHALKGTDKWYGVAQTAGIAIKNASGDDNQTPQKIVFEITNPNGIKNLDPIISEAKLYDEEGNEVSGWAGDPDGENNTYTFSGSSKLTVGKTYTMKVTPRTAIQMTDEHMLYKCDGAELTADATIVSTTATPLAATVNESSTVKGFDATNKAKTISELVELSVKDADDNSASGTEYTATWTAVKDGENVDITTGGKDTTIETLYGNGSGAGDYTISVKLVPADGYAFDGADEDGSLTLTSTITINGPGAVSTGEWEFKKLVGESYVNITEEDATYDNGLITIKKKNTYKLTPAGDAGDVAIKAEEADSVVVIDGARSPKTITITDGSSEINVVSGNANKNNLLVKADGTIINEKDDDADGKITPSSEDVDLYTGIYENKVNSDIVSIDGDKFGLSEAYEIIASEDIDDASSPIYSIATSKDSGVVYAKSDEEIVRFDVSANAAGDLSSVTGADNYGKLTFNDLTTTSVSFNIAATGGLTNNKGNDISYTSYLVSMNGAKKVVTTGKTVEFYEGNNAIVKFDGLTPGREYSKLYVSANSSIRDEKMVILGSKTADLLEAASGVTKITTLEVSPTAADIEYKSEPEKITVTRKTKYTDATKNKLVIALLSENKAKSDDESTITAVVKSILKGGKTPTDTSVVVGLDDEGSMDFENALVKVTDTTAGTPISIAADDKLAIEPGKSYVIYAAFAKSDGTLTSDLVKLADVATAEKTTINVSFSKQNFSFKYLGVNKSIEKEVTTVSSPSTAKTGEVIVKAIKKSAWDPEKTVDQNFNDTSIAIEVDKKNVTWNAGEYYALAKYVPDAGDTTYKAGETVSTNFTITKQKVYARPIAKEGQSFTSISTNQKIGADNLAKLTYEIISENGKNEEDPEALTGFKLSNIQYAVDGKIITANTSFSTVGEKKITISLNGGNLIVTATGDSADNYELIADELTYSIYVLNAGDIYLSTSKKPLYYYEYYKMANDITDDQEAIKDYIVATMEGVDVTDISEISYIYRDKEDKLIASGKMPTSLSANDWLFVSANYAPNGDGGETYNAVKSIGIRIEKQPVRIIGTDESYSVLRWSDSLNDVYGLDKAISIYPYEYTSKGDVLDEENPISDTRFSKWQSVSDKEATIDVSKIDTDTSGTYVDLPMYWDSVSVNTAFSQYYDIVDAYLGQYKVSKAFKIKLMSTDTGAELYTPDNAEFLSWNEISGVNSFSVSLNSSTDPDHFALAIPANNGKTTTLIDQVNDADKWAEYGLNVTKTSSLHWTIDVSGYHSNNNGEDLILYGVFKEPEAERVNESGTIKYTSIDPVFYDGNAHVMTEGEKSRKGVKPDLDLTIYNAAGGELIKGTDYTASYKNNKNVGYANDTNIKKRPTVVVKGKGEYKSLKLNVYFTILPQSFQNATIAVKNFYVANKKNGKISIGETVKIGNAKVSNKNYTLTYYDANGNLMKESDIAKYYDSNKVLQLEVKVTSKQNGNKAVNFSIGETSLNTAQIMVYPKGGKKFNIKLNQSAYSYSSSQKTLPKGTVWAEKNIKSFKAGSTALSTAADITAAVNSYNFYSDKNLTKLVGDTLQQTGTYYLAIFPSEKAMTTYNVYQPTVIKVNFNGKKINKFVGINKNYKKLNPASDKKIGLDLKSTKDGTATKDDFIIVVKDVYGNEYKVDPDVFTDNGKTDKSMVQFYYNEAVNSDSAQNIAVAGMGDTGTGTYKFIVRGKGQFSGDLNLSYAYAKGSQSVLKNEITVDIAKQKFNAAGYGTDIIKVYSSTDTKKSTALSTTGDNDKYKISSVKWTVNSVGEKKGSAAITFKNYSGTYKALFDVEEVPVQEVEVIAPSVTKKDQNKSKVYLQQTSTDGERTARLKAGKDYVVGAPVITGTSAKVEITIPNGSRLKGGTTYATYSIIDEVVKNIKITGLSVNNTTLAAGSKWQHTTGEYKAERIAGTYTSSGNIVYNESGKYYEYQGDADDHAVMPMVTEVTCTYGSEKNHVIEPAYYDVDYTPVTVTNKDGRKKLTISKKYKVTITINSKGAAKYPSFETASYTYAVNQNSK